MRVTRKNILHISLLLAATSLAIGKAQAADCSVSANKVNITINSLKIDPDAPVGSVLKVQQVNTRNYPAAFNCGTQALWYGSTMGSNFSTESAISGVYETGLTGIGIRVTDIVYRSQYAPYTQSPAMGSWSGSNATGTVKIEIIKTGEIPTVNKGKFKTGTLVTAKVNSRATSVGAKQFYEINIANGPAGGWTAKSCTLSNSNRNQTVQMGTISKSDFNSGGYGPVKNFKLVINCPDGIPTDAPVKISFERMTSGASDGFMDVDSTVANAAQNVGVEVRDNNNTLLKFSSDYTYTSSSVSNKELTLPMTARYKAATTVGNIGPGTANTGMTVTIDQD